jgi:hypothetical protein
MAYHVEFNRILDRIYKRRTDHLRRILDPKSGQTRRLTKKRRERAVDELQEVVSRGLSARLAKTEFNRSVAERGSWHPKGWARKKKQEGFRRWIRRKISRKRGKVYVFWKKREMPLRWSNWWPRLTAKSAFQERVVRRNDEN